MPVKKIPDMIIFCACKSRQAVQAAAQQHAACSDIRGRVSAFYGSLCKVIGRQRILRRLQRFLFIETVSAERTLLSCQKCQCVLQRPVYRFHAECRRVRTVKGDGITDRGKQKTEIGIVGIAHEPFGRSRFDLFPVDMREDLTHKLAAAAGQEGAGVPVGIEVHEFVGTGFGRIADPRSAAGKTVRAGDGPVTAALQKAQRIFEG